MTRSKLLFALALACAPVVAAAATGNYAQRPEGKALLERLPAWQEIGCIDRGQPVQSA